MKAPSGVGVLNFGAAFHFGSKWQGRKRTAKWLFGRWVTGIWVIFKGEMISYLPTTYKKHELYTLICSTINRMSMNEPVYFLKLELENVRCFGEKAELDLSDGNGNWRQWTVILGDNGTGKTTLLQCISMFEASYQDNADTGQFEFHFQSFYGHDNYFSIFGGSRGYPVESNGRWIRLDTVQNENAQKLYHNCTYSPFNIHSSSIDRQIIIYGYGANRMMDRELIVVENYTNTLTLFVDAEKLINAENWLLQLDYAASRESEMKEFAQGRKMLVETALLSLLPDIEDIRFTTPTKYKLTPNVEFLTPYGNWVTIHRLSLGYKTMVAWMVDLAARMFARYPESDNPLAEPAIVLVDEIDLHLHPKWQRKIFGYLSERFPKTQFVVTAHSPLVVQSAPKDANIVVLRKEGDHVVIDNDVQSVHNWRLDQILSSDLFGGIPSRNPEVEIDLERRKLLIQRQFLSPEEESELEKLNKKADKIPQAESEADIEAKEIIRKAAEYYRTQGVEA